MPVEHHGFQLVIVNNIHEIMIYKDKYGLKDKKTVEEKKSGQMDEDFL